MKKEELTFDQKRELIDDVLSRGVGEFFDPNNIFRKKLEQKISNESADSSIVIKFGIDPTKPDIHLGHAAIFRKLRKFQELGCKVIFLVGDFTAQIGDPTGKHKTRPEINYDEIKSNVATYLNQVKSILDVTNESTYDWTANSSWYMSVTDFSGTTIDEKKNDWLGNTVNSRMSSLHDRLLTITLFNFLFTLRSVTHSRLIARDMFQNRINKQEHLFMHEMMYPVLQATDSYAIAGYYGSCDLEIGGTDQTFNMLMGRDVMELSNQQPQAVMSVKLLEGLYGKEKMSKSLNNYIAITDGPNKMFTSVMSIPDTSIINYFELATDVPMSEIHDLEEKMKSEEIHPRDLKTRLAKEIVALYHSVEAVESAQEARPSQAPPESSLVEFMVKEGLARSKSEARRKIEQGGVELDGKRVDDWQMQLSESDNGKILKVGKKDFVKLVF